MDKTTPKQQVASFQLALRIIKNRKAYHCVEHDFSIKKILPKDMAWYLVSQSAENGKLNMTEMHIIDGIINEVLMNNNIDYVPFASDFKRFKSRNYKKYLFNRYNELFLKKIS